MDFMPLWISIKTATTASIFIFILGLFVGYRMMQYKGRAKGLIDGLLSFPLVLPPTVMGYILLLILGKNGILGRWLFSIGIPVIFTWEATVIAAVVVSFPLMYRTCRGAFEQIDKDVIGAARTLGLNEYKIFLTIALPLAAPGVIAGLVLSFARALGEFGATLMIAGNIPGKTQTMPLAIFFAVEGGEQQKALLWVSVIVGFSILMIILMNLWGEGFQRKVGKRGY